jgi:hypothetical protein
MATVGKIKALLRTHAALPNNSRLAPIPAAILREFDVILAAVANHWAKLD